MKYLPEELVYDVILELNDRQDEVVNVLSKNMLDFCDLSKFVCGCLAQLNPMLSVSASTLNTSKTRNTFQLTVETFGELANKLLNTDPQQTEIYFLEYALDDLIDIMVDNVFKRNEILSRSLYCFV